MAAFRVPLEFCTHGGTLSLPPSAGPLSVALEGANTGVKEGEKYNDPKWWRLGGKRISNSE